MLAEFSKLVWPGRDVLNYPVSYPTLELAQILFHPEIDWQVVEEL